MKNTITALLAAGAVMAPSASLAAITPEQAAVLGYAAGQVVCTLTRYGAPQDVINTEMERLGADAYRLMGESLSPEDVVVVMQLAQHTFSQCPPVKTVLPDA